MKQLTLTRQESTAQGTLGLLIVELPSVFFYTGELPDKNDQVDVSCIPLGQYTCRIVANDHMTELFGRDMYQILDVPGRTDCFIHAGNYFGDVSKGYRSDVEGCILLGMHAGKFGRQQVVTDSRSAIQKFMDLMGGEDFILNIIKDASTLQA